MPAMGGKLCAAVGLAWNSILTMKVTLLHFNEHVELMV